MDLNKKKKERKRIEYSRKKTNNKFVRRNKQNVFLFDGKIFGNEEKEEDPNFGFTYSGVCLCEVNVVC